MVQIGRRSGARETKVLVLLLLYAHRVEKAEGRRGGGAKTYVSGGTQPRVVPLPLCFHTHALAQNMHTHAPLFPSLGLVKRSGWICNLWFHGFMDSHLVLTQLLSCTRW